MSKTFEEWWEQNAELWCGILNLKPTPQLKAMAKIIWDYLRLNMTTKDI